MTIKQKLIGCLALFALIAIALVGAFALSERSSRQALSSVLADRVMPLKDLKSVADSYAVQIVDAAHKARNGNLSFAEANALVRAGSETLRQGWARYRATRIEGEEETLATAAEQRMKIADERVAALETILAAGDRAALDRFVVDELYQVIDPVSEAVGKLVDIQIDIASKDTQRALDGAKLALMVMLGLAAAALAVLAISFFTITRKVIAPITDLAHIIGDMAGAQGEATLPALDQRDEIGDISRSVDAFLQAALATERDRAAAAAAEQEIVTTALRDGLAALAAGDLTVSICADFPPGYGALKTNFNDALVALQSLIGTVKEGAAAIRTGSAEIAQASEDLARRTEANAASLEQTTAAVSQMEGRAKATASAARDTVGRADGAIATVAEGRAVADHAVQAMSRVSESAKGIDDVIEGLDKIAFQTRVLAMNAAVEAGRAGEAGRGFAVVADLVSALAMRAEEEAGRAREQLSQTQGDIGGAVDAVRKVDGALERIATDVGQVHSLLGAMATDNQAQSATISQIAAAINSMDHATQQNAAMVEQTSAAARNLSSEVLALSDQADRFRMEGGGALPARNRRAMPDFSAAAPIKALPSAAIAALRAPDSGA